MRPFLALLLILVVTLPAEARPIEVQESFPHGVLYLLESLREEPHHSQHLRKVFLERHPLTPAEARALAGYRTLMEAEHTRDGPSRSLALEVLAADSGSVEGLVRRAEATLPASEAAVLRSALLAFQQPYRLAVWEPCQEDLERQVSELEAGFARADAPRRLDQVADFMGSLWPEDRPLRVLLTPIPKEKGLKILTYGHSNGALQVAEAPTGAPQKHAPPVLFHEMCHALWRERAEPAPLEEWFRESPLARQQLDEGLATALGNAWFAEVLTGSVPSGPWYENAAIDGFARALYPLVSRSLREGGRLDEAFVRQAIRAFDETFPDAWRRPAMVSARLLLVAEEREDLALSAVQALSQAVQLRECFAASPAASEEARRQFRSMAGGMVVFLTPTGALPALGSYPIRAEDRQAMAARRSPFLWSRWTGDRWLVVASAPTAGERRALLVRFLKQARLEEGFLGRQTTGR